MDDLDLLALAKPLGKVTFPDGSRHQLVPFDAITYELWNKAMALPAGSAERSALGAQVLQRCVPTANDENFTSLGGQEDLTKIILACRRQVDLALVALGNSGAAGEQSGAKSSPPSDPTTTPSPSSSGSGASPVADSSTA